MAEINDTPSRLSEMSVEFRKREIARNEYDRNDAYESTHENSISDGDEKGKGEKDGSVGSKTDISVRHTLNAKNKYSLNNPYGIDNA